MPLIYTRKKLQSIDNRSIWRKFVDALKSLLGIHTSSNYYVRMMNALEGALNVFDVDSYFVYNRLKPTLHKVYNDHKVAYNDMTEAELKSMLKETVVEKQNDDESLIPESVRKAMQTGNWDEKSVAEYNNLIKDIQDGKINFKRTVGEGQPFTQGISEAHAGASILLRGSYGAAETKSRNSKEQYEAESIQGKEQERKIEAWAKAEDLWLNDYTDEEGHKAKSLDDLLNSQWAYINQGSEAEVYMYDDNNVLKSINLSHSNDNVAKALDKIALFNHLFSDTAMEVVGFGRDSTGHFRIIVTQPYIQGNELTDADLINFIDKYGLKKQDGFYHTPNEKGLITDLGNYNILKDSNNNYFVIDADVMYNTPYYGGNVVFDNSITSNALPSFIDSMSRDQIIDELNIIDQEFFDYDLVNNRQQENKGNKGIFTFNDGITVNVPFTPNDQQVHALNVMNDFIYSDASSDDVQVMTLSGYAGTGKTSLMQIIASKFQDEQWEHPLAFCATTHAASKVLNKKVKKLGFKAKTMNSMFGIKVEVDKKSSYYDAANLRTVLQKTKLDGGTTVFIDEASMINEQNFDILMQVARQKGLKIIFMGDKAQLPPVNETKVSKVFRLSKGNVVELTKVERTGDNAILNEATRIRNGEGMSYKSSFNNEGKGVAYINSRKQDYRKRVADIIRHYLPMVKDNPDAFRVLAYDNNTVSEYNDLIRNMLGYKPGIPNVGETIIGYNNMLYDFGEPAFANSMTYKITRVFPQAQVPINFGNIHGTLTTSPIEIVDLDGKVQTINFIDIKTNQQNRKLAIQLAKEKARLWLLPNKKGPVYDAIHALEEVLFVNDVIYDDAKNPDGTKRVLQSKVFDWGYAMTVHKSQGSTFTNILIDRNSFNKAPTRQHFAGNPWASAVMGNETSVTAEDVQGGKIISEEDVLGDSNPHQRPTPPLQPSNNESDIVNERQSLEYVAVSRATDTVTVISEDAEVEDSPLNHLNGENPTTVETNTVNTHIEGTVSKPSPAPNTSNQKTLNITPVQGDISAKAIGSISNKFIGFADGIEDSPTAEYARQAGNKANTGEYGPEDTVFVSILDNEGDESIRHAQQQRTIDEALSALESGATLIIGNFFDNDNAGEKKLARALINVDASYVERTIDGQTIYRWYKRAKNFRPIQLAITDNKPMKIVYQEPDGTESTLELKDAYFSDAKGNPINDGRAEVKYVNAFDVARRERRTFPLNSITQVIVNNTSYNTDKALSQEEEQSITQQIIEHIKNNLGIHVHNAAEMRQYLKEHGFNDVQEAFSKRQLLNKDLGKDEIKAIQQYIKSLPKDIDTSRSLYFENNGYLYKFNTSLSQFDDNLVDGDGFEIISRDYVGDLPKEQLAKIEDEYKQGRNIDSILQRIRNEKGSSDSSILSVENRQTGRDNVGLDLQALQGETRRRPSNINSQTDKGTNQLKTGFDGTSSPRYTDITETFTTPEGEIYGFVTKDGEMYLDETKIKPELPLHEYTHIWDNVLHWQ